MKLALGLFIFSSLLVATPVSAEETKWSCPDKTDGRLAFLDGTMADWPNYSETHGSRVQRQHPETAFTSAQAKFIERDGRSGGICQYYNHIGLVATSVVPETERVSDIPLCTTKPCPDGPYWRQEYVESLPEQDIPGEEQMWVCMEQMNGISWPSTSCGFISNTERDEG